jgi:AraC-like DNA-binding protein
MTGGISSETQSRPSLPLLRVEDLLEVLAPGQGQGVAAETLASAQLPPDALSDPRDYLGVDSVWRLFSAQIAATGDELLNLGLQRLPAGLTEIVVARALHEDSIPAAMATFCEVINLLQTDLRLSFKRQRNEFVLNAIFPRQIDRRHQIYLEIACMPWLCTFCWMSSQLLPLKRFVTHPARAEASTQLLSMFGCPVEFRGDGITLVYSNEIGELAISPPALSRWRQGIYAVLLERMRGRQAKVAADGLESYVEAAVRNGILSQSAIADSAAMSVATLRRHLQRRNTSLTRIRDSVIRDSAPQLLHAGYTVEAAAEQLGYSDARSFRRAFRRVLGRTPAEYRAFTDRNP